MTGDVALQLISRMLWTGALVVTPLLGITLFVSVLVSIFQVVTQIQEVSLSFIPKIITIIIILLIFGPWMLKTLVSYASTLISSIPSYL